MKVRRGPEVLSRFGRCSPAATIRAVPTEPGGLVAGARRLARALARPSASCGGPALVRLPTERRRIALTLDDGPSNETPRFLDLLARLQVRATFFVCGANAERHPDLLRSTAEAGHGIGNHTYSHPCLPLCSGERVKHEIARTQAVIGDITGRQPRLFRAPYGLRTPGLGRILADFDLRAVHWSVMGNDWKWKASRIADRVLRQTDPGGIICLHDGDRTQPSACRAETLRALENIVPHLVAEGYRFVALPSQDAPGRRGN